MIKSEILVPSVNANEPEARLVGIYVKDGQAVEKGARLFTIETTKAASDIELPETGFVRILVVRGGQVLAVGERLAAITEQPDEKIGTRSKDVHLPVTARGPVLPNRRWPWQICSAWTLATFPVDRLVTEEVVRQAARMIQKMDISLPPFGETVSANFWRRWGRQKHHGYGQGDRQIHDRRHPGR